jgi:hypothetical protein
MSPKHLDRMLGEPPKKGRPPVGDDRRSFSCKLPPAQIAALRLLLAERRNADERPVDAPKRQLDLGDLVKEALDSYLGKKARR